MKNCKHCHQPFNSFGTRTSVCQSCQNASKKKRRGRANQKRLAEIAAAGLINSQTIGALFNLQPKAFTFAQQFDRSFPVVQCEFLACKYFKKTEVMAFFAENDPQEWLDDYRCSSRSLPKTIAPIQQLQIDFLSGKFDSKRRRQQHQQRLQHAKITQPQTQTIRPQGSW